MHPAPARVSDVNGACRCWAPLGFWPYVMPRERLTITSAIAVRERKHIVFSDTGFGTSCVRSLVLDRLCSAACAAVGFPGWDVSHVRAICEQLSPAAKRKLHLRQGGDQELPEKSRPNTPNEKLPSRQTWGFIISVADQGGICRAVLTKTGGELPSTAPQPGKSNPSTAASSSHSGPAEGCKDCRVSSQVVPGVSY